MARKALCHDLTDNRLGDKFGIAFIKIKSIHTFVVLLKNINKLMDNMRCNS